MEKKKNILLVLFVGFFFQLFGQTNKTIYEAYISGNMGAWKKHMDLYKAYSNEQKLNLINFQYGFIAYCIDQNNENEAEKQLKKAETLLDELNKQGYKLSILNAYKSAFIGFKIGLAPHKAPFIGQKSLDFAKKSIVLDDTNYFGYVQLGNIAFYTPTLLGGSKTDAMKHYLKALELMEKNPASLKNNWNYLNLLATIINAYYEIGEYEKAKMYCIKTLEIESQFDWIKNDLYPKTLKKTGQ